MRLLVGMNERKCYSCAPRGSLVADSGCFHGGGRESVGPMLPAPCLTAKGRSCRGHQGKGAVLETNCQWDSRTVAVSSVFPWSATVAATGAAREGSVSEQERHCLPSTREPGRVFCAVSHRPPPPPSPGGRAIRRWARMEATPSGVVRSSCRGRQVLRGIWGKPAKGR